MTDDRPDDLAGPKHQWLERVIDAYDINWLMQCRLVVVGTGGSLSFIENMARTGLAQFVFVDPDGVEPRNLATQRLMLQDVGTSKVKAAERMVRAINPVAATLPRAQAIEDISDAEFHTLAFEALPGFDKPLRTLLCGFTDSFWAQARVNRLSLNFGLPSLCGQMYEKAWGAEATITFPGVTSACHRCMLSKRYEHYLNKGFKNHVGSFGAPIWGTERLNALLGDLAMTLLHHGTNHPRYGNRLTEIGNRTMMHVRFDPHIKTHLNNWDVFDRSFAGADASRLFYDETIWKAQDPNHPQFGKPQCPDCGGTGDLSIALGSYSDTRPMRDSWVEP